MRRIAAATTPSNHRALRAARAPFAELSSDPTIRRALWEEQGGHCAYCERTLRDPDRPDHQTRIEHFHPQSASLWTETCATCSGAGDNRDAPTRWTNLLLCCDGNQQAGKDFTCDKSKANSHICADFRNPKTWSQPQVVVIDRDGRARPAPGLPHGAVAVIDNVLRLNTNHLIAARKRAMSAYLREIHASKTKHHGLSDARREQFAARFRDVAATVEYGSVLLMLADHLARKTHDRN
ncbi:HNH endonuclease family protein [Nocardia heshunensis]